MLNLVNLKLTFFTWCSLARMVFSLLISSTVPSITTGGSFSVREGLGVTVLDAEVFF